MTRKERWDLIFSSGKDFEIITDEELNKVLAIAGEAHAALDLACGTGDVVTKLAQRNLKVTGMDISSVALDLAKARITQAGVQATLSEGDLNNPHFTDQLHKHYYDVIFLRLAFTAIEYRDVFLEHVKELLTPGGAFICISPVLLPEGSYDASQAGISLPKQEIENTLHNHFSVVQTISEASTGRPDWPVMTYLCRNNSHKVQS